MKDDYLLKCDEDGILRWDSQYLRLAEIGLNSTGPFVQFKSVQLPSETTLNESSYEIQTSTQELPSVDDVVEYMQTKPNFKHDTIELHTYFLGRIIKSRGDEQSLYHSFATIIRNARDRIEQDYQGTWTYPTKRKVEGHRPVRVYELDVSKTNP